MHIIKISYYCDPYKHISYKGQKSISVRTKIAY